MKMEIPKLSPEEEKKAEIAKRLFLNSIPPATTAEGNDSRFKGEYPVVAWLQNEEVKLGFSGIKERILKSSIDFVDEYFVKANSIEREAYNSCLDAAKRGGITKKEAEQARDQAIQVAWLIRSNCLREATEISNNADLDMETEDALDDFIDELETELQIAQKSVLKDMSQEYAKQVSRTE